MGMLIDGRWTEQDQIIHNGAYRRQVSRHNATIPDEAIDTICREPGRYHLILSLSCPWSHRVLIVRELKQLHRYLPVQIAGGVRHQGYPANFGKPWRVPGTTQSIVHLHQLYTLNNPRHSGRVTVPILWDSVEQCIVSDESARIMRALDALPAGGGALDFTLLSSAHTAQIDALNERIYHGLCNAVYEAGFAETQSAYEAAVEKVFATLDELEARLASSRYLMGAVVSEADWRLFPTLARFDVSYFPFHHCWYHRLIEYSNLWAYARDLFHWRGIATTVDFQAIVRSTYDNDVKAAAFIRPVSPRADWFAPHGRDALGPAQVWDRRGRAVTIDPASLQAPAARPHDGASHPLTTIHARG